MLFLKVEIDQWRSSGKVPFVATLLLASVSVWRTRLGRVLIDAHAAEYDLPVSSTRKVNSYPGDGYFGASRGEWRHQRTVICCDL